MWTTAVVQESGIGRSRSITVDDHQLSMLVESSLNISLTSEVRRCNEFTFLMIPQSAKGLHGTGLYAASSASSSFPSSLSAPSGGGGVPGFPDFPDCWSGGGGLQSLLLRSGPPDFGATATASPGDAASLLTNLVSATSSSSCSSTGERGDAAVHGIRRADGGWETTRRSEMMDLSGASLMHRRALRRHRRRCLRRSPVNVVVVYPDGDLSGGGGCDAAGAVGPTAGAVGDVGVVGPRTCLRRRRLLAPMAVETATGGGTAAAGMEDGDDGAVVVVTKRRRPPPPPHRGAKGRDNNAGGGCGGKGVRVARAGGRRHHGKRATHHRRYDNRDVRAAAWRQIYDDRFAASYSDDDDDDDGDAGVGSTGCISSSSMELRDDIATTKQTQRDFLDLQVGIRYLGI